MGAHGGQSAPSPQTAANAVPLFYLFHFYEHRKLRFLCGGQHSRAASCNLGTSIKQVLFLQEND